MPDPVLEEARTVQPPLVVTESDRKPYEGIPLGFVGEEPKAEEGWRNGLRTWFQKPDSASLVVFLLVLVVHTGLTIYYGTEIGRIMRHRGLRDDEQRGVRVSFVAAAIVLTTAAMVFYYVCLAHQDSLKGFLLYALVTATTGALVAAVALPAEETATTASATRTPTRRNHHRKRPRARSCH
jgi:hypothetical protein